MNKRKLKKAYPWANKSQLKEIQSGLKNKVNFLIYAKPEFNCDQMREIRLGLESGVSVLSYADARISPQKMKEIRSKLFIDKI